MLWRLVHLGVEYSITHLTDWLVMEGWRRHELTCPLSRASTTLCRIINYLFSTLVEGSFGTKLATYLKIIVLLDEYYIRAKYGKLFMVISTVVLWYEHVASPTLCHVGASFSLLKPRASLLAHAFKVYHFLHHSLIVPQMLWMVSGPALNGSHSVTFW